MEADFYGLKDLVTSQGNRPGSDEGLENFSQPRRATLQFLHPKKIVLNLFDFGDRHT